MADFHFDFEAVEGLEYTEAFQALFKQMEDHYNANFSSPKLIFGALKPASPVEPNKQLVGPPPKVKPDFETITPKTIALKSFSIKADNGRKRLVGVTTGGEGVNDLILPGYDEEPYGAVLSGEHGRYNLKGI